MPVFMYSFFMLIVMVMLSFSMHLCSEKPVTCPGNSSLGFVKALVFYSSGSVDFEALELCRSVSPSIARILYCILCIVCYLCLAYTYIKKMF